MIPVKKRLFSDAKIVCIAMEYIAYDDATVRTLAAKYGIGKSTVWDYLQLIKTFDARLYKLISFKARCMDLATPYEYFNIKDSLREYLIKKRRSLESVEILPAFLTDYLWSAYLPSNDHPPDET